jgi:hypothetical protein
MSVISRIVRRWQWIGGCQSLRRAEKRFTRLIGLAVHVPHPPGAAKESQWPKNIEFTVKEIQLWEECYGRIQQPLITINLSDDADNLRRMKGISSTVNRQFRASEFHE